jgi:hypothetical protein
MTEPASTSLDAPERGTALPIPSLHWRSVAPHLVKAAAGIALAWLTIWLMAGHSSGDSIVALVRF